MKSTTETSILRGATLGFLLFGIALILSAHGERYLGQLSAQLPVFEEVQTPYSGGSEMAIEHRSAPADPAVVAMTEKQLALGMLIVIVGFFLHILIRYRHGNPNATAPVKKAAVRPAFSMK